MTDPKSKSNKRERANENAKGALLEIADFFWFDNFDTFGIIGIIIWIILLPIIVPLRLILFILGLIFSFLF